MKLTFLWASAANPDFGARLVDMIEVGFVLLFKLSGKWDLGQKHFKPEEKLKTFTVRAMQGFRVTSKSFSLQPFNAEYTRDDRSRQTEQGNKTRLITVEKRDAKHVTRKESPYCSWICPLCITVKECWSRIDRCFFFSRNRGTLRTLWIRATNITKLHK